jgi:tetratricopeptide (TPR) repeat protein
LLSERGVRVGSFAVVTISSIRTGGHRTHTALAWTLPRKGSCRNQLHLLPLPLVVAQVLAIKEAGGDTPQTGVAMTLTHLATTVEMQHRLAEAETLMRRALVLRRAAHGENSDAAAAAANNVALLLKKQGRGGEAITLYTQAQEIYVRLHGAEGPEVAGCINNIASVFTDQGKLPEALEMYERSLDMRERTLGIWHPDVQASLGNLAALMRGRGELTRAVALLKRQLAGMETNTDQSSPALHTVMCELAGIHLEMQQYAEAKAVLVKVSLLVRRSVIKSPGWVALSLSLSHSALSELRRPLSLTTSACLHHHLLQPPCASSWFLSLVLVRGEGDAILGRHTRGRGGGRTDSVGARHAGGYHDPPPPQHLRRGGGHGQGVDRAGQAAV